MRLRLVERLPNEWMRENEPLIAAHKKTCAFGFIEQARHLFRRTPGGTAKPGRSPWSKRKFVASGARKGLPLVGWWTSVTKAAGARENPTAPERARECRSNPDRQVGSVGRPPAGRASGLQHPCSPPGDRPGLQARVPRVDLRRTLTRNRSRANDDGSASGCHRRPEPSDQRPRRPIRVRWRRSRTVRRAHRSRPR
jgi:hypothetical protein